MCIRDRDAGVGRANGRRTRFTRQFLDSLQRRIVGGTGDGNSKNFEGAEARLVISHLNDVIPGARGVKSQAGGNRPADNSTRFLKLAAENRQNPQAGWPCYTARASQLAGSGIFQLPLLASRHRGLQNEAKSHRRQLPVADPKFFLYRTPSWRYVLVYRKDSCVLTMKPIKHTPYVGAARDASCRKTVEVFTRKLGRLGKFPKTGRMLDVGCGDGTFTMVLGQGCSEVHAVDVQENYLARFRNAINKDEKFVISNMSASALRYPDGYFDTIVTIETLEHVVDLNGSASEICRVLKSGGELLVTVPNRWFPFETHGMRIGKREFHRRIPFLTYLPWLHRRLSVARVFKVRDLDSLFVTRGLKRVAVDYAWPTFEHGGNVFQPCLKPFFGLMRRMEDSFLRMLGTSVMVHYVKE